MVFIWHVPRRLNFPTQEEDSNMTLGVTPMLTGNEGSEKKEKKTAKRAAAAAAATDAKDALLQNHDSIIPSRTTSPLNEGDKPHHTMPRQPYTQANTTLAYVALLVRVRTYPNI